MHLRHCFRAQDGQFCFQFRHSQRLGADEVFVELVGHRGLQQFLARGAHLLLDAAHLFALGGHNRPHGFTLLLGQNPLHQGRAGAGLEAWPGTFTWLPFAKRWPGTIWFVRIGLGLCDWKAVQQECGGEAAKNSGGDELVRQLSFHRRH